MSHVISAQSATSSVHAQARHQCMIATWSVHAQSRDLYLISHVISAFRVTWSGPAELRDSCRLICLTIASWASWFLPGHVLDYCQLSSMIRHCWAPCLLPADCVVRVCSALWVLPPEVPVRSPPAGDQPQLIQGIRRRDGLGDYLYANQRCQE